MTHSFRNRGNTVVEILVTLAFVALTAAVLMPLFGPRRSGHGHNRGSNSTQVRGIIKAIVIYANEHSNEQYPGIDGEGQVTDSDPAGRFLVLLTRDRDPLEPVILVNPVDDATTVWDGVSTFTSANHSYALLDISEPGARRKRWSNEIDASTPLISDRNTATDGKSTASVWNDTQWEGAVGWGDGHVTFENSPVVDTSMASADHLFAGGPDDAWLRHNMTEPRVKP